MNLGETALVIVDPWSTHYITSWFKRASEITRTKIEPIVEASRRCGMKIIYAPAPEVAKKYPQWTRFASDTDINPLQTPPPDWPPPEFRERTGEYAQYYLGWDREPACYNHPWDKNTVAEVIQPKPEDFVVATGEQLHRLLRYFKVLHLFYCGFAANMCIPFRDYGMRPFHGRGYNLILIRDATTAVETHDTVEDLLATRIAVRDLELAVGFSTTTDDYVKACNNAA